MEDETKQVDEQESLNPAESEETLNTEEEAEVEEITEVSEESQSAKLDELYKNQKVRAEKAEAELKKLEKQLNAKVNKDTGSRDAASLDVEDYIDISASLEGLDQREKEKLAREHKLTGRPLSEIRKDEDFVLWQEAYRQRVEKERALNPSTTQEEREKDSSLSAKLAKANTLEETEKILEEAGLYKAPRPKADRVRIDRNM